MKNIIKSLVIVFAVAAIAGGATYALFSDTETSNGNTFMAGTLDLELGGSVQTAPVNLTNMKPGDSTAVTFDLHNAGSLPGVVSFGVSYVEADGTQPVEFPANMSADDFAKMLQITSPVTYSITGGAVGDNIYNNLRLGYGVADGDASNLTVYDLKAAGTITMPNTLIANGTMSVAMSILFDTAAGNDYQADGITATFNGTLNQLP